MPHAPSQPHLSSPLALLALAALAAPGTAQSWEPVQSSVLFQAGLPLLMTDGTVIIHSTSSRDWYRLTPDAFGIFATGAWSNVRKLPTGYGPLYYASAVLADGRVIVMGGEYNFGNPVFTKKGAVYDPLTNTWTSQPAPTGWTGIGDAQCCVLPDGRFLLADPLSRHAAVLNPATLTWTDYGTGKADGNDEEGWTLLPDGSVLTVDAPNAPHAERLRTDTATWVSAGNTPQSLVDPGSLEMGPGVLRTNGTVLWLGGTGHTAFYTPPLSPSGTGSWTAGPNFPVIGGQQYQVADGPACLLPSGKVLSMASPGVFATPSRFFEFDGATVTEVPRPAGASGNSSYQGNLLVLPNGQVLYTDFSPNVQIYTPTGAPLDAWRPTISGYPTRLVPGGDYLVEGTQFNGLSQACFYGDDSSNATNYPLVRLRSTDGRVRYARTHDHSTMAVATGSLPTSTHFTLPKLIPAGTYELEVVANGIASFPVTVRIVHALSGVPPIDLTH